MSTTHVTIQGNLTGNPEEHTGRLSGEAFTTFRVAHNDSQRQPDGSFVETGTTFFDVSAFGQLGVNTLHSLKRGDPVVVTGRLRVEEWVRGEQHGTNVRVTAANCGPDLLFGRADFHRARPARVQAREDAELHGPPIEVSADGEVLDDEAADEAVQRLSATG